MNDQDRAQLIAVSDAMADAARAAILPHFRKPTLTADNKLSGGFDPVTVADRAAEQAMRAVLEEMRPQDAIFGEEFGTKSGTSGLTWVLDPIDGTRGFISGTPTWGVLIAVSDETGPIYGVVDQPYIGERFKGGFGLSVAQGPHGEAALATRDTNSLSDAILFTTFPEVGTQEERAAFERVAATVKLARYGMDCYAYALVAAGQVDLVIEAGLNAYDIQAPIAVIEAAGGVVTNWEGGPAHDGGRVLAAANQTLHRQALDLLSA
ncbi:histidinol-phosphatase [Shimia sp. R10_1]|uniref:histidinol-phosphatase n=1 Tax=Shimia sp. R10_1 TaxID=2821095 RepID=UPI001ADC9409|nr:histidinol-phosphatase [Shimia sp. R10_1]MBO9474353.1 histidinol-phosphatase [Shimia sp. R10_1]